MGFYCVSALGGKRMSELKDKMEQRPAASCGVVSCVDGSGHQTHRTGRRGSRGAKCRIRGTNVMKSGC